VNERQFWQTLRRAEPWDWAMRIESRVTPGCPDICFVINGTLGWLELKSRSNVRMSSHPLRSAFEPTQMAWHAEAQKHSVFAHCLLFSANRAILLPAIDLRVLAEMTLAELLHTALWIGGTTPRTRFVGLREKLEQTGETLRMARTCHPRQSRP
jgi:hypothetical protein